MDASDLGVSNPDDLAYDDGDEVFFVAGSVGGEPSIARIGRYWDDPESVSSSSIAELQIQGLRAASGDATVGLTAVNPADGLLYRFDPDAGRVDAFGAGGKLLATYDSSSIDLSNPEAILFAPSSDITDGPESYNLFVADSGDETWEGGVTELTLEQIAPQMTVPSVSATLVQTITTSNWSPPSTDPSGITWDQSRSEFIVVDSEVNETSQFRDVNVWKMSRNGAVMGTGATHGPDSAGSYSDEPTGVAYRSTTRTMFITDDTGVNSVYVADTGPDAIAGTADDLVTQIDVDEIASDPEDPEYHINQGVLFFLSGVDREVFRIDPVDGVFGNSDDRITSFNISHLGPTDFEGLTSAPVRGTLYLAARTQDTIFEITTNGTLLRTIDVSISGMSFISGLAMAPSSSDPSTMSLWFVDRGADEVNDGKAYEISVPDLDDSSGTNTAPVANDDTAITNAETAVTIDVLANDSDGDGDALTVANVSNPANGSVTVKANQTISYTPDPGHPGSDTFTYQAFDGIASSNTATVTVTVMNDGVTDQFAVAQESVFGSTSSDLASTFQSDDVHAQLVEEHTGGRPSNRISRLDHRWTFNVAPGDVMTFVVEARRSANSEGDDFELSYSTDGAVTFDPLVVVTATSDTTHTIGLPSTISGTVIVRAIDIDRTAGNGNTDSLFVDRMLIRTDNAQDPLPSVTIGLGDATVTEPDDPGAFTVTRDDTVGDLVVLYTAQGTATEGTDYVELAGSVTIVDGQASATIPIVPIDDALSEGDESVVITLTPDASYQLGFPPDASLVLGDDDVVAADHEANSQETRWGTILAGDLASTYVDDGQYLQIGEQAYAGGKRTRFEHQWSFDVGAGGTLTFFLQAHRTATEGFMFAFSTDGTPWTNMVQVAKLADDGKYQQYALPAGLTGSIMVRVVDMDRTRREPVVDSIFVDDMFIRSEP